MNHALRSCASALAAVLAILPGMAAPEYSVAGFIRLPGQEPTHLVLPFNVGWTFAKGDHEGAERRDFNDSSWQRVNLPHGIEILPEEASGCSNYQGPAWYRKSFRVPGSWKGKRVSVHFEGIMGKSSIWLNGEPLGEYFGGYLPVIMNLDGGLLHEGDNVIAVRCDNSDDPSYPPGKPQKDLDFCYFGGIYRDAYLTATGRVYITDPNEAATTAGGGVFFRTVSYDPKSRKAMTKVKVQVANETDAARNLIVNAVFTYPGDTEPYSHEGRLSLEAGAKKGIELDVPLTRARPWSPADPHLYALTVSVYDTNGKKEPARLLDHRTLKVGIRTIKLDKNGLTLNGKPYPGKLIGGNRHQDFAMLGNAVPNNLQWRDAIKLHEAGVRVVRCAHYPMDPAFMDACDELGIFVIVATPGWQFWGKKDFAERVYDDIRQMVRRDRNRASVLMWEPILNETGYPEEFAQKAYDIVHEEYPGPFCFAACDSAAKGAAPFDVHYMHPPQGEEHWSKKNPPVASKAHFTREFGDNVDDWSSHNSPSRVSRAWGEIPMLIQAVNYLKPPFTHTSLDALAKAPADHFGGCLWHPFDHQRGYHPDPFYGGLMDAYRQPKTSWYAFRSQVDRGDPKQGGAEPMVYIAHECTPFSPADVTVFTNCEAVRLTVNGGEAQEQKVSAASPGLPHPPLVFKQAWDFMAGKSLSRQGKGKEVLLVAEGLVGGKVVARHETGPARRPVTLALHLDHDAALPEANGSDVAVVIASVTDGSGRVKRLNNERIRFEVEGPAELIDAPGREPGIRPVIWGTAPVLLRMGDAPGKVIVRASVVNQGLQKPKGAELTFEITAPRQQDTSATRESRGSKEVRP